ncbi:MAG: alpha/beta hydrolase [Gemmatimonadota bacterium]
MAYRTRGEGDPLLLLHGFGDTDAVWNPVLAELASDDLVILPNLRGHGQSTNPSGEVTHRAAAQDVFGLLDASGIGEGKAAGHSTGGMTLLHMVTAEPGRGSAMALLSGTTHFPDQARQVMGMSSPDDMPPNTLRKRLVDMVDPDGRQAKRPGLARGLMPEAVAKQAGAISVCEEGATLRACQVGSVAGRRAQHYHALRIKTPPAGYSITMDPIVIRSADDDDPEFVAIVSAAVRGMAVMKALEHLAVVIIDNWFDDKWSGFPGVFREYLDFLGSSVPVTRSKGKALPPFARSRVIDVLMHGLPTRYLAAVFYVSSGSRVNQRGSLLASIPTERGDWNWYVGFKKDGRWRPIRHKNIGQAEFERYVAAGTQ